jgi:hypothetical protein
MEKINGFNKDEVIRLIDFIKKGRDKGVCLSALFEEYGKSYGRAKGSVRNFYYQLLKEQENNNNAKSLLAGKNLKAEKIVEFNENETNELVKSILKGKGQGRSVRSIISELSKGNDKLMLRFQNKYRNILRTNPELIERTMTQLKDEFGENFFSEHINAPVFSDFAIRRLQREINGLYNKLNENLKRENKNLKERIIKLENENIRLKIMQEDEILKDKSKSRIFFERNQNKRILN